MDWFSKKTIAKIQKDHDDSVYDFRKRIRPQLVCKNIIVTCLYPLIYLTIIPVLIAAIGWALFYKPYSDIKYIWTNRTAVWTAQYTEDIIDWLRDLWYINPKVLWKKPL